jgi:hypothetical protein
LLCDKYWTKKEKHIDISNKLKGKKKTFERIDTKTFPEHLDSSNYFRNQETLEDNDTVSVTVKLHGSSGRFGNVLVRKELTLREKFLIYIGVDINEKVYDYVAGSRRVIKEGIKDTHFYTSDIWNDMLEDIKERIPKDYILYGEIIGWTKD